MKVDMTLRSADLKSNGQAETHLHFAPQAETINVHVRKRLRRRRQLLGLTQKQLADAIGLNFQQIQKYESGVNRISASCLLQLSQALGVPVLYFYDGLVEPNSRAGIAPLAIANGGMLMGEDALDLLQAYNQLKESERRRLLEMAKSLKIESAA